MEDNNQYLYLADLVYLFQCVTSASFATSQELLMMENHLLKENILKDATETRMVLFFNF